jgi:hypothetical protein
LDGQWLPAGFAAVDRRARREKPAQKVSTLNTQAADCATVAQDLQDKTNDFNDFRLWVQLPVPINTLSDQSVDLLDAQAPGTLQARKDTLTDAVFSDWVERIDQVRCRLFLECLSADRKSALRKTISDSLQNGSDHHGWPSLF